MVCMFLGNSKNYMGGKYHILNLRIKYIVLRRDITWINKTYGEYISRQEHTKDKVYITQDEDKSDKWDKVKCILSRRNTQRPKKKVKTKQDYRKGHM